MWEEVQLSPWGGGGQQEKRHVPEWQLDEQSEEEGEEKEWGKRREKAGGWTFSKKEPSWGGDKDLASEVGEVLGGGREKKAANQANILNILSQLILEANEDKEDKEKEDRKSRYL